MKKVVPVLLFLVPFIGCVSSPLVVRVETLDGSPAPDAIVAVVRHGKPFGTKVRMERTDLRGVASILGISQPHTIQVVDSKGNFFHELLPTVDKDRKIMVRIRPGVNHAGINPDSTYITEGSLFSKMDEEIVESWNLGIERAIEIDESKESNKSSYSTPGSGASLRE